MDRTPKLLESRLDEFRDVRYRYEDIDKTYKNVMYDLIFDILSLQPGNSMNIADSYYYVWDVDCGEYGIGKINRVYIKKEPIYPSEPENTHKIVKVDVTEGKEYSCYRGVEDFSGELYLSDLINDSMHYILFEMLDSIRGDDYYDIEI